MRYLLLLLLVGGCNKLDCESVGERLFEDCKLTFGHGAGVCAGFHAASEAEPVALALNARLCEAGDPEGDEDCYLTATCTQIESGECAPDDGPMRDPYCLQSCATQVESCAQGCRNEADASACEGCVLECNRVDRDCRDLC